MPSSPGRKRFLVVVETLKVKDYLFASPFLREVRGASMLLDKLNTHCVGKCLSKTTWSGGVEEVYFGGGSGRALFEKREEADAFAARVKDLYREYTVNARVSAPVEERREGENFAGWVARAVGRSREEKLAGGWAGPAVGGRWVRPCTSCGAFPAERPMADIQGEHMLCRSCHCKRTEINYFYRYEKCNCSRWLPVNLEKIRNERPDFILSFLAGELDRRYGSGTELLLLPVDFDDIGEASRPGNYMGLIYADGNRMGEVVKGIGERFGDEEECKQAYRAFSEIVDRATKEAAAEAVIKHVGFKEYDNIDINDGEKWSSAALLGATSFKEYDDIDINDGRKGKGRYVPAEFIMAGGDDLILAVPAHCAVETAATFLELFHEKTKLLQQEWIAYGRLKRPFREEGLSTSAGVVVSHCTYPAVMLVELASELMKSAKRREAQEGCAMGTLDFMVEHSSVSESLKTRRKEYERRHDGETVMLTERPYTPDETRRLVETIRKMKKESFPRGKLEALYSSLFQDNVLQARFDSISLLARLKDGGTLTSENTTENPFVSFFFGTGKFDVDRFPFRRRGGRCASPLSELVELYDFVHPRRQGTAP